MPYKLLKQEDNARRGEFTTVHGTVQTPAFMNVGTAGGHQGRHLLLRPGGPSNCQVELCNTYHLHLRPGDELIGRPGRPAQVYWAGMRPILTDSGGFQVFSLAKLRKISEEGVHLRLHIWTASSIFMGPEESMQHPVQPGLHHRHGF